MSPAASVKVFTGVDIPNPLTDLKCVVTEDGRGVELSWTPPTEGVNGGYVDSDALYYRINCMQYYEYVNEAVDHYTYYLPEGAPQGYYGIWVYPCSAAGRPSEFKSDRVHMGIPYSLPATEHFTGNEMEYSPLLARAGDWHIENPTKVVTNTDCEDGSALILLGGDGDGELWMPMFDTTGEGTPVFSATIFNHSTITPSVTPLAKTYGMDSPEVVGNFTCEGTGWTVCSLPLPAKFYNRQWVSFFLSVDINEHQALLIDEYTVSRSTGINGALAATFSIVPVAGGLQVKGANDGNVHVFTLDGKLCTQARLVSDTQFIPLSAGVYMVNINGKVVKVAVK